MPFRISYEETGCVQDECAWLASLQLTQEGTAVGIMSLAKCD